MSNKARNQVILSYNLTAVGRVRIKRGIDRKREKKMLNFGETESDKLKLTGDRCVKQMTGE